MEDYIMEIYEASLLPVGIIITLMMIYALFILIGLTALFTGSSILQHALPTTKSHSAMTLLKLGTIGATIASIPTILAFLLLWRLMLGNGHIGLIWTSLSQLILIISYGALSGLMGSTVLRAIDPREERDLVGMSVLSGGLGGTVLGVALFCFLLLCRWRKQVQVTV
jgi:hypothetical protein